MQKYFAIFRLSFVHALKNYKALVGLSIFLITCLIIFAHLWKIAAAKKGIVTFSPDQLLWYIAFNEWVLIAVPDVHDAMELDLRSGSLAYRLPRPISYLGSIFMESLGTLTVNLLFLGAVTVLFTWLQVGMLPFEGVGLLVTLIFGFAAGIIGILFRMIIGVTAFWLQTVDPFFWIWEKLLFMLGGLMLPLTIYPQWIQKIAHMTPFPVILGERSALALDFSLEHVLTVGGSVLIWGGIGFICLWILYNRGLRILNVEGG